MLKNQVVGPIRRSHLAFAIAATIALGGCASIRQSMSDLFGEKPPPTATPAAAQQGQTYYAAAEGLAVYAEASTSSKVVGRLALHEKVVRSRLERGYAYVTVAKRDLAGWVDNAQLVWRLPGPAAAPGEEPATAGAATPGAEEGAKPGEAVEPETPPGPELTPTSTLAPRQPPAAQPPATPSPPSPSIFNPF